MNTIAHRIIYLLFLCLAILAGCSLENKYESEELKAFNDVFSAVISDDYEILFHFMNPEQTLYYPELFMNDSKKRNEFINCSRYPEKYDSVLAYCDNYHKPFFKDFKRMLIEAKGNKKKIVALLKSASEAFSAYHREILNKSRLLIYTDNKLRSFRDTIIAANSYNAAYDSSYFYQLNLKELEERSFKYAFIKNTGKIEIKDSAYPVAKVRKQTPEIEIGKLAFSRIAFNPDFTKGKFILFFKNGRYGDKVTSLIYINKFNGRWHYKSAIQLKCFSVE